MALRPSLAKLCTEVSTFVGKTDRDIDGKNGGGGDYLILVQFFK